MKKIMDAANRLEELTIMAKMMVQDLRDDAALDRQATAYVRVYALRRELSRIVASLGAGQPSGVDAMCAQYEKYVK